MVRVVYDYSAFTRQFYGGVSRYFVELARAFSKSEQINLRIVAPFFINRYLGELDPELVQGRQIRHVPREVGRFLNFVNHVVVQVDSARIQPDVLHETYFSSPVRALGSSCPRVITVHDMIHEKYPEHFSPRDRTSIRKLQAIERADHIICVSDTTRKDLLDITGVTSNKVSVVHHGFRRDCPVVGSDYAEQQVPYILYVGVRGGYKNFSKLLEAYASNSFLNTHFRMVCFGGGKFCRSELGYMKSLGLAPDRVVWAGGSDNELTSYYARAAAFVCPSLYEGFGMPLLEAMDSGCPIVCSNSGSIPEIVGSAAEFFDPRGVESISSAIENVVGSIARSTKLRNMGVRRLEDFSWQKCAEETLAVYSAVA